MGAILGKFCYGHMHAYNFAFVRSERLLVDSSSATHPMLLLSATKYKKVDTYVLRANFVTRQMYYGTRNNEVDV